MMTMLNATRLMNKCRIQCLRRRRLRLIVGSLRRRFGGGKQAAVGYQLASQQARGLFVHFLGWRRGEGGDWRGAARARAEEGAEPERVRCAQCVRCVAGGWRGAPLEFMRAGLRIEAAARRSPDHALFGRRVAATASLAAACRVT